MTSLPESYSGAEVLLDLGAQALGSDREVADLARLASPAMVFVEVRFDHRHQTRPLSGSGSSHAITWSMTLGSSRTEK